MTHRRKRIAVIGAGASGIAAAIEAAKRADVMVLEHTEKPLIKLLVTGNGRCNFSNSDMNESHFHGNTEIIRSVLSRFSVDSCLDFMEECHVEALEVHYSYNKNGYFYPSTNRAETVRNGMLQKLQESGARILTGLNIRKIEKTKKGFLIHTDREEIQADAVIFACGSNAAPETGSDSSIYPVLKKLGVGFTPYLPALTGIKTSDTLIWNLKGMRCKATVWLSDHSDGTEYHTEDGEVQFGNGYLSGIPILDLSRFVSIGKKEGHEMSLHVIPRTWENVRKDACEFPEVLEMICTGTRGFSYAQCCSGGVDAEDIDPDTLGFVRMQGIYFCGEMIDVDGDCGGYNLHFAFGSGILAGKAASQ